MLSNELIINYNNAMLKEYSAVSLDIGGTLTKKDLLDIDDSAIEIIANLLKKGVPIIFNTGRGETGLGYLVDDIYDKLSNDYNVSYEEMKKMYALLNDGARLAMTSSKAKNGVLFDKYVYISSKKAFDEVKDINRIIIKKYGKTLNKFGNITYSLDEKKDYLLNIRLVLNKLEDNVVKEIKDFVDKVIKYNKMDLLNVNRGIYKDGVVVQIGTAEKGKSLSKIEKYIGVSEDKILRIGDCGDIYGNDYAMLDCPQGFSVNKRSGKNDRCFPVIDKEGNILKGLKGTMYLIDNVDFRVIQDKGKVLKLGK